MKIFNLNEKGSFGGVSSLAANKLSIRVLISSGAPFFIFEEFLSCSNWVINYSFELMTF